MKSSSERVLKLPKNCSLWSRYRNTEQISGNLPLQAVFWIQIYRTCFFTKCWAEKWPIQCHRKNLTPQWKLKCRLSKLILFQFFDFSNLRVNRAHKTTNQVGLELKRRHQGDQTVNGKWVKFLREGRGLWHLLVHHRRQ